MCPGLSVYSSMIQYLCCLGKGDDDTMQKGNYDI